MTLEELKQKRADLGKLQWKEYTTMGNTQKCQQMWVEICELDEQIEKMERGDK